MSRLHQSRIADFQEVLGEPTVALAKLRDLCFSGIPFDGGLRCLCWKILLNYLPLEKALWSSLLKKQRDLYSQFLKEMIIQPGIAKANLGVSREDVTLEDHPLNPNPDSRWNTYFKDNEVLLQIDKDVRRLYPDMAFFQRPTDYPCLLILDPQNEFETLRKRVEQTTLKSQTVARNRSGVTNQEQNIKPQFFAFRWLTLLLSQEFLLPDVIRIWDSLFADDKRFDFLLLVCCAMLTLIRDQLLEGDFTLNMRLLQDYPISDVHLILKKAKELQDSK
ncbi:TBC1 domain family member 13 isoform X2 [Gavia stellata]|uniref:TBC1 domain family member 13 isoform X2 n=1 Tax=Gymnogyps californianus TaxID=33616 RepID=UPI0021C6A314|nr:TBC1 domain family member 13 isoform X2 [Gymnogyps californianus]XP_059684839.1 TBC1 domain family member 13 isoform X2 [Gavia stellata]